MNIEKWKKAVVHLECATDMHNSNELIEKLKNGEIDIESFDQSLIENSRETRYTGTSIFFENEGRRYLITARHVVWDKDSLDLKFNKAVKSYIETGSSFYLENMKVFVDDNIFQIMFKVPTYDEFIKGEIPKEFLMNLGAGVPSMKPFTFSDEATDLAIISLDNRHNRFADELIEKGYLPINIEDLDFEDHSEGKDVFSVGYPASTSTLGNNILTEAQKSWSSSSFSLPVSSFGKIAMNHPDLDFFWADISIYPGNSGGPLICDNKLIGVVVAQPVIPIENANEPLFNRIPFGKIIKIKKIRELLKNQIEKDKNWLEFYNPQYPL